MKKTPLFGSTKNMKILRDTRPNFCPTAPQAYLAKLKSFYFRKKTYTFLKIQFFENSKAIVSTEKLIKLILNAIKVSKFKNNSFEYFWKFNCLSFSEFQSTKIFRKP